MQAANAVTPRGAVSSPSRQQQVAPPAAGRVAPSQPLLYQAARDGDTTIVKRLLATGGIDVNAIDPDTRLSALMLAARHGHDDVAFLLTKGTQGVDMNLQNSRGDTALSLAAAAGKNDVVELLLLKKAQSDQANHSGRTALAETAAGRHLKTAELLIASGAQVNAGAGSGEPPLVVAAQRGDGAMAELLLEKKASLDSADRFGWTAFNHAADMGHAALAQRLRGGAMPADECAVVESLDEDMSSAAEAGHDDEAAQGITITTALASTITTTTPITTTTAPTTTTLTTLTTVVTTQPAYMVRAAPGTPVAAAADSLTALRKAVERNDLQALNQIMAAHPDRSAMLNQTIAFERQRGLLPAGSYTLLMLAAAHGHKAMVEALLALGADVDARSGGGMSALLVAARHRQIETVEALLKAGADVDAQTTSAARR